MTYLLDTNIITAILKRNEKIVQKLEAVGSQGQQVYISCITYYEVKRGLLYVNATRQLSEFEGLCRRIPIILLDDLEILERAAEIHADLKLRGTPIQEADIFIAATAITRGLILVSHDSDMLRVRGVTVENWFAI